MDAVDRRIEEKGLLYETVNDDMPAVPMDKNYVAYMIMFYEGVGNLFPWNAFITAAAYYAIRFCGTSFAESFENYFSFAYNLSQALGLALSVVYQNNFSIEAKIMWPLSCYAVIFLITTAIVVVEIDPNLLFWITLISIFLCGLCGAIQGGGIYGLAAKFPPAYTGALMNGQGLAGLIVATSSVLTTLIAKDSAFCDSATSGEGFGFCADFFINYSALAYFAIGTTLLATCIGAFFLLRRLEFARYYMERSNMDKPPVGLIKEPNEPLLNFVEEAEGETTSSARMSWETILRVFKLIRIPALSVALTFTITLGIYPILIVLIESQEKCNTSQRFSNDMFVPLQFLFYTIFDFVGRVAAGGVLTHVFSPSNVWIAAVSRVVFFPLFLLCNVQGSQLPVVFVSDAIPILLVATFAFSNGYTASACMVFGPSLVRAEDAPLAGTIMLFALTLGCLFGACVSFLTLYISQGHV